MTLRQRILWSLWALALVLALWALFTPADRPQAAQPVSAAQDVGGYVALTFDDGPWPGTTETLLEGLARRGVKATFFLIGNQAEARPDTVRRMADQGHQVGIHTWDHVQLEGLAPAEIEAQIGRTRDLLTDLLGPETFYLRPPYGFVDDTLRQHAHAPILCWDVDTEDWKDGDRDRILATVLDQTRDGSIILMHDIFSTSVEAALACVDALMARGYTFVTLEELFALRQVTPEDGQVYMNLPPNQP